ncbi:MAG: OmpG porin family protein [Fusobacteriaceae bacterium]
MKSLLKISLGIFSLILVSGNVLAAEVLDENDQAVLLKKEGGDSGVQKYNEDQIRFFELEKELESLKAKKEIKEFKFTGFVGTKVEIEELSKDVNEGKVKFVLSEGSFKHNDYENWSLFYHVAKEQYFKSKMWDRSGSPQNTIVEIVPRYSKPLKDDKGSAAFEFIYTSESIDDRDAVKLKPSLYYKINDKVAFNYYTLIGREFKGGNRDDYEMFEMEPGLSYKFNDNTGAGVNYFMKWGQTSNEKFTERERFFKPYIWRNFEDLGLGLSLWSEVGPYKNKAGDRNNNTKVGISGNKSLTESLKLIGEVSYKREEKKKSDEKIDITLMMLGLQYSF